MDLLPILIAGCGRSGTTTLMELLATDPRVAFDRRYPDENRYLTYLAKFALLTGRAGDGPHLSSVQLCDLDDGHFGAFPWPTNPVAGLNPPLAPPPAAWLAALWSAFSTEVRRRQPQATYYAEKAPAWLAGVVRDVLPCRTVHLVRDPRDIFLSARAFGRARNPKGGAATSAAKLSADPDRDDARDLTYAALLYFENERSDRGRADVLGLRYKDLIADRPAVLGRLNQFLGLELASVEPAIDQVAPDHRTTPSPAASVGRWRQESLPAGVREFLEAHLHELLTDNDFEGATTAPAPDMRFADLLAPGPLTHSADGELRPGPDGMAAVRIVGPDFWVNLPPQDLMAEPVREAWVSARGDTGSHCSLYWRGPGQAFAEERSAHVPFQPGRHWHILRFRMADHPHWRGPVEQLRLDLFNGSVTAGADGAVRWLRLVS